MLFRLLSTSVMVFHIACMPSNSHADTTTEKQDRSLLQMLFPGSTFRRQTFEPIQWAEAGSGSGLSFEDCLEKQASCPRGPMVYDLLNTQVIANETPRATAFQLLGPAELVVNLNGETCDAYKLGMCTGFEEDVIYVCYGADDTVSSAGQLQP